MSTDENFSCAVCGNSENLLRCSRCKLIYYCSKEHQRKHWKKHRVNCEGEVGDRSTTESGESSSNLHHLPLEGSSEAEILATSVEKLNLSPQESPKSGKNSEMPITTGTASSDNLVEYFPNTSPYIHKTPSDDMINVVIEDLNSFGLCVLDNFCGAQMGKAALQEVLNIYKQGIFQDGQLVAKSKSDTQSIRSDKIMWVDGKEVYCRYIGQVLNRIDNLIMKANKSPNNGRLGYYNINGRTKAMIAVYPGSGTHYVKHVDNPNNDGRCITAIYYLNVNWDVQKSGGLLRIFPENEESTVADIAPIFDRLLLFWSDRQNPHEVQPAYDTRYAITLWYFDATERALATKKFEIEQQLRALSKTRSPPNPEQLKMIEKLQQDLRKQNELRRVHQQQKNRKHEHATVS